MDTEMTAPHNQPSPGVIYLPNFIDEEEEAYLIRKVQESSQQKWKVLANRRLQIWGGDVTAKGTLCVQPLPDIVRRFPDIVSRIRQTGAFSASPHGEPNHIIMNEYLPGQGIMPHEDGPIYHPVVATLTLGSHCAFHYYRYKDNEDSANVGAGRAIDSTPARSLLLERRSLVITFGDMYTSHLHGIDEITEDFIVTEEIQTASAKSEPRDDAPISISNFHLLHDESLKQKIRDGKPLQRDTRWSMTCRDVARTVNLSTRGIGFTGIAQRRG